MSGWMDEETQRDRQINRKRDREIHTVHYIVYIHTHTHTHTHTHIHNGQTD